MDNSMEQRFVDRLLHALAAMGEYGMEPAVPATVPATIHSEAPTPTPISH